MCYINLIDSILEKLFIYLPVPVTYDCIVFFYCFVQLYVYLVFVFTPTISYDGCDS